MSVLGILGARNAITKQMMQDEILNPVLDNLTQKPSKIIMPSEPLSSTYIECWAQRKGIETILMKSDWVMHGRRAGIMRDSQIQKECNVFLIFEGPKSRYYLDLAERIAKSRPCEVYVVESKSVSPVLLEVDRESMYTIAEKDEKDILTITKMWSTGQKAKCLIEDD